MKTNDRFSLMRWVVIIFFLSLPILAKDVTLAWDNSTEPDVVGYKLYYGELGTAPTVVTVTDPRATATDLLEGHAYFFYVTAFNSAGLESDPSPEIDYTVPIIQPPDTLKLEMPVITDNQIILSAQGEAGQKYLIQVSPTSVGTWTNLRQVVAGADGLIQYAAARTGLNQFFKLLKQ